MTGLLDKLNLKPQERRLVVIVAIVVFVVLNFWFIFPVFGELGKTQRRIIDERDLLTQYQREVSKAPIYQRQLDELKTQGDYIPSEKQGGDLLRDVQNQARASRVNVTRYDFRDRSGSILTNAFFDEKTLVVNIVGTGQKELIDFLFRLSSHDMPTGVRQINLSPDPPRQKLAGSVTFVRSYQRKPSPSSTVAPAATGQASTTPATNPPTEVAPTTNAPAATNTSPDTTPSSPRKPPGLPAITRPPQQTNGTTNPATSPTIKRELPRRTLPTPATP